MRAIKQGRWRSRLAGAACISLGLSGCSGLWDDLTARDRPFGTRVKEIFVKPDPLLVLRDSKDGDHRAKALRRLQEPKQHGGTDAEQDFAVQVLVKAGTTEHHPLTRLAAIETMGHFKDPRVVKGLQDAFYNAADFGNSEIATRIQCQALWAMGEVGNSDAVPLLVDTLNEPPATRSDLAQQRKDRCLAAARALGHFKDYKGTDALAAVLKNEKEDLALRDRAHESLQLATGESLPPDYKAWEAFLHPDPNHPPKKKFMLASWFTHQ